TVSMSMPHVYANQVEFMCDNLKYRENVLVSLHPHNDRGCAVADSELGLLAGADRIEGTLFGNGERTGNVDIVTLGLNMYAQGVEPMLDFSDLPELCEIYERVTGMQVYDRQPYSGKLVFAAFSGSHQDAIAKGMKWREETGDESWTVPYLPIDPVDVGREYESAVIRINSQSGKGGIGYLLEKHFGYVLPYKLREEVSYTVKDVSDKTHAELSPDEVEKIFADNYINRSEKMRLVDYSFRRGDRTTVTLTLDIGGEVRELVAEGPGRLESAICAVEGVLGIKLCDLNFDTHELDRGNEILAVTYLSIVPDGKKRVWGTGVSDDIITSSILALISAANRMLDEK
ncbi:MAG: 2-isopropylmalate synthase, partial [Clostridia bacterium]|nr:2-isopropylmalate synthase [Clostridia bacterium]